MANTINPAADFQALPIEMLIATPLIAAVKAQKVAADATVSFIKAFIDDKTNKPQTIELSFERLSLPPKGNDQQPAPAPVPQAVTIKAPMLSIVPVPHLRIDSVSVNFKYEISQVFSDKNATAGSVELEAKTGGFLSPWVQATLKGSVSHSSSAEATTNRSGILDITVRASEAPVPEGLTRLLTLLSRFPEAT